MWVKEEGGQEFNSSERTIRLLLGLQRPASGRVEVLGRAAGDPRAVNRLGALVEMPSLYPNLTGLENLRVTAHHRGCDGAACHAELDLVGLRDAANQKVNGYSLGMKQRLGLASALMHGLELLILDEPTNGLDPAGIMERGILTSPAEGDRVWIDVSEKDDTRRINELLVNAGFALDHLTDRNVPA